MLSEKYAIEERGGKIGKRKNAYFILVLGSTQIFIGLEPSKDRTFCLPSLIQEDIGPHSPLYWSINNTNRALSIGKLQFAMFLQYIEMEKSF